MWGDPSLFHSLFCFGLTSGNLETTDSTIEIKLTREVILYCARVIIDTNSTRITVKPCPHFNMLMLYRIVSASVSKMQ